MKTSQSRSRERWTDDEVEFVLAHYKTRTCREIAEAIGRSERAVRTMVRDCGGRKNKWRGLSASEIARRSQKRQRITDDEVGIRMEIASRAKRLGIPISRVLEDVKGMRDAD